MLDSSKEKVIVMAVFFVTRDDVLACADELGIPEERITDEVIELVKDKVGLTLRDWRKVVKSVVKEALNCPLGMACSPSCPWREISRCTPPTGAE